MTFNYREEILRTFKKRESIIDNLLLVALGLNEELEEAVELLPVQEGDREELAKELGDVRAYLEFGAINLGIDLNLSSKSSELQKSLQQYRHYSGAWSGKVKKIHFHGHQMVMEDFQIILLNLAQEFANLVNNLGYQMNEVELANVQKLRSRYPQGFSSEDSIKRIDVKKE